MWLPQSHHSNNNYFLLSTNTFLNLKCTKIFFSAFSSSLANRCGQCLKKVVHKKHNKTRDETRDLTIMLFLKGGGGGSSYSGGMQTSTDQQYDTNMGSGMVSGLSSVQNQVGYSRK